MSNRSDVGQQTIRRIKKDILKRKIMLNFIIDSYSWWDRAYRWTHICVATLTPLTSLISITVNESSNRLKATSLVLSCVVAGMVKLKEYIKFSEIRDVAKSQTIKYSQLYERIERESLKPNANRQPEDQFIYWINREFMNINLIDPELSPSEKTKFLALCRRNNITYNDDVELLHSLMEVKVNEEEKQEEKQARPRNNSDCERSSFQETLRRFKPGADMDWTRSRMNDLR